MINFRGIVAWYSADRIGGMLTWSSNISRIFIVNRKIALVFETEFELRMKNHCGESVGFSFRAALWFPQWFCLCEVSETVVMLFELLPIFTVKCDDSVSFLSCFLVFLVKDQIASFQLKEILLLCFWTKCSVCVFITLRECNRVWITTASEYCMQLIVWTLNMIEKSKIVFYFLQELKRKSSDVTGR